MGALDELRDKEYADERPRPRGLKAIEDKKVSKGQELATLN